MPTGPTLQDTVSFQAFIGIQKTESYPVAKRPLSRQTVPLLTGKIPDVRKHVRMRFEVFFCVCTDARSTQQQSIGRRVTFMF